MNVTDCPLSIVGLDGEIDGADRTGLIITSLLMEFAVSCGQVVPNGPVYHTALYGAVPPDHVPVMVVVM